MCRPAAGGNTDMMARLAAEHLAAKFGKPFVVENRPSAGGALASGAVVHAAPDGYTIMFTPNSMILLTPLVQKMSFDPDKELTAGHQCRHRFAGRGGQTQPRRQHHRRVHRLRQGAPGEAQLRRRGHQQHQRPRAVAAVQQTGVNVVMVPSRGEPQAISDLKAGNVDFYFGQRRQDATEAEEDGSGNASTHDCVGISNRAMRSPTSLNSSIVVGTLSVAGLIPMTASPQP